MRRLLTALMVGPILAAAAAVAMPAPSVRFLQRDPGSPHALRLTGHLVVGGAIWARFSRVVPGQRVVVDWGDGTPVARLRGTRCGVQAPKSCSVGTHHTYSAAGRYQLTVRAGRQQIAGRRVVVSAPVPVAPPPPPADADVWRGAMLAALNQVRRDCGVSRLAGCAALDRSAEAYAQLIGPLDWFSHTGPGGSTARERIAAAGYAPTAIGENLAGGTATVEETMQLWRGSPGHLANMVSPMFRHVGFGRYDGTGHMSIWVQDFGRGSCPDT